MLGDEAITFFLLSQCKDHQHLHENIFYTAVSITAMTMQIVYSCPKVEHQVVMSNRYAIDMH